MQLSTRKINSETMKLINIFPLKFFYKICLIIFFSSHIVFSSVSTLFHIFSLPLAPIFLCLSKNENKTKLTNNKTTQDKIQHKQNKRQNSHKQQSKTWVIFVLANFLLFDLGLVLDWLICLVTFHWRKLIFFPL